MNVSNKRPKFDPETGRYVWRPMELFPRRLARPAQEKGQSWHKTRQRIGKIVRPLMQFELTQSKSKALYIVGESETGIEWHDDILGATSGHLADILRPQIKRWRGSGPAMVVRDSFDPRSEAFDVFFLKSLTTAVHEAVHLVEFYPDWSRPAATSSVKEFREFIKADPTNPPRVPKWAGHGVQFLRLCLHARYRVEKATGIVLPLCELCGFQAYGYSMPQEYLDALQDELISHQFLPLSVVKTTPVPSQFMAKWLDDIRFLEKTSEVA